MFSPIASIILTLGLGSLLFVSCRCADDAPASVNPQGALVTVAVPPPALEPSPVGLAKMERGELHCLGSREAKAYGIFLHGIDTRSESAYFAEIKREWQQLASRYGIQVILPRAPWACSSPERQGKLCWNWNGDNGAVVASWQTVLQDVRSCGGPAASGRDPLFVIGHSNGGYFLNRLHELCQLPKGARLLSIGSAGAANLSHSSPELPHCGELALMVGQADSTYPKTLAYYENLRKQQAQVRFEPYQGGHDIPFTKFVSLLDELRP